VIHSVASAVYLCSKRSVIYYTVHIIYFSIYIPPYHTKRWFRRRIRKFFETWLSTCLGGFICNMLNKFFKVIQKNSWMVCQG